MFANSCITNRYTDDCLSRHLLLNNASGGGVAYVGYLDVISIGLGNAVEKKFFADLARTAVLGVACDARASMVVPGSGFDVNSTDVRYTIFMMGLLGDPALRVHGAGREYLVAADLASGRRADGGIEVVYTTPDHKVAHLGQAPSGGWTRAAVVDRGSWSKRLAVGSNADRRLEVVYIGSDNKLYHIWQTTPNGSWTPSYLLDG